MVRLEQFIIRLLGKWGELNLLTIRLNNLRFHGHIGVYPEEKVIGQNLEIDVILQTNIDHNEIDDHLERTLNYGEVYRLVSKIVTESKVDLVEALAHDLVVAIKTNFASKVQQVTVRIRKLNTPMNGIMDNVEIEVQD